MKAKDVFRTIAKRRKYVLLLDSPESFELIESLLDLAYAEGQLNEHKSVTSLFVKKEDSDFWFERFASLLQNKEELNNNIITSNPEDDTGRTANH